MTAAIAIHEVSKRFGPAYALERVNLTVGAGEMVALIGASGSGKSTLLRHVAGFLPTDRDGGRIETFGTVVQHGGRIARDVRCCRADIGFVFQQFNLVGRLSVLTNVLAGLLYRVPTWRSLGFRFTSAERAAALAALRAVGIETHAYQRASTLSGGQQQRAAIARALVQGARIILADEPIASLDPESARNVMEILARLNREQGLTVLVSLHQVDFALRYCTRTVALNRGQVVYDGASDALTREALARIYGAAADDIFASETRAARDVPVVLEGAAA
jgi:phosphonate transport system ATP-binding protein